jgi:hypothetical protein
MRGPGSSWARAAVEPGADRGGADAAVRLRPGPQPESARREVAEHEWLRDLVGQVTEVNEPVCQARPAVPGDEKERTLADLVLDSASRAPTPPTADAHGL